MIGEFRLIESYMYAAVSEQSHDPYTCDVYQRPYIECLDMSSYTNNAIALSGSFDIEANFTDVYDIFGQGSECLGKKHGDGIINVFDLSLVLAYIFSAFPELPSDPSM
eukprot:6212049-Pleurochrysis_carterae.AAC.1